MRRPGSSAKPSEAVLGTFEFTRYRGGQEETCLVDVYGLRVERQLRKWAEMEQRSVLRCSVRTALTLVCSPMLARLIGRFVDLEMKTYSGLPHDSRPVSRPM